MPSSDSESDTSYKRGNKRKRSRSRSHKRKTKSKTRRDTKSRERSSSKYSRYKFSKSSIQHKSSIDTSPKHKSSREKSSKHRSNKSPMRLTSNSKSLRDSPTYEKSKDKKSKHKVEAEKIDNKDQIKKALQAAASVDEQLRHNLVKDGEHDFNKQQERAEQINDIEKGDFIQTNFKSSRSEIPMPKGSQVDASHASAMFGNYSWKDDVSIIKNKDDPINDIIQLMHPNLLQTPEEKFEKWKDKLFLMRKVFLKSNRGQLPWQI